jgi:heme O synthase-like polyprenyltransferase
LVLVALTVAWFLHPLCFVFGLSGTVAASVFRKRVMCVIQGGIAGCAPVLIGYVAVTHQLDITILFLCILIVLYAASIALWVVGDFGWLYFAVANVLGIIMVCANYNLLKSDASRDAWKVYKLSAFPYLGVMFSVLCLNFWI